MKRKSGQDSFISDISALLDRFYQNVVQDLKAWAPPAPRLQPTADDTSEQAESSSGSVNEGEKPQWRGRETAGEQTLKP